VPDKGERDKAIHLQNQQREAGYDFPEKKREKGKTLLGKGEGH